MFVKSNYTLKNNMWLDCEKIIVKKKYFRKTKVEHVLLIKNLNEIN